MEDKEVTCKIIADFLGMQGTFDVTAGSHEQAIEEFKKMPLIEVFENFTMGDVVDKYDATTTEIDLSGIRFTPDDEHEHGEMEDNFSTDYDHRNVCVGDFAKIHGDTPFGIEPHLFVTRVGLETIDCKGDYGVYRNVPFSDILDIKTEEDIFKVAGIS